MRIPLSDAEWVNFTRENGSEVLPMAVAPFVEHFSSGYVQRAVADWPKQGRRPPWRVHQDYFRDWWSFRCGRIDDGALVFSNPAPGSAK